MSESAWRASSKKLCMSSLMARSSRLEENGESG
jgi:hypothetical protein